MNYNKKTIMDVDVAGKKILLRCDFNVPQDKETHAITSDKRIVASLPTIRYLLERGGGGDRLLPPGQAQGPVEGQPDPPPGGGASEPAAGPGGHLHPGHRGRGRQGQGGGLQGGQIMLLENLRFDPREEKNDPEFARELASMAELYVSDAFGTVHRAHASTAGVAAFLPAVSGLLVARELEIMGGALENPKRPFVAVLGGAKVSDKIGVINNLLEKADTIIIGGGMAYTFARAQGGSIGKSLCEPDKLDYALQMIQKAKDRGVQLLLPTDTVAAAEFSADADSLVVPTDAIPDDMEGLDIGPETIRTFCAAVRGAGTVVWNGPMGVFEFEKFAAGTRAMAQALADSGAITIVGGGDSAAAVEQMGFADRITHISTGGGASLEFLEGIELPGVACLLDK